MNIGGIVNEKQSYFAELFTSSGVHAWKKLALYISGSLFLAGSLHYWTRDVLDLGVLKGRVNIDGKRMDLAAAIAIVFFAIIAVSLFFVSYPKDIATLLLALAGVGGVPLIIARFVYPKGDRLIDRFV